MPHARRFMGSMQSIVVVHQEKEGTWHSAIAATWSVGLIYKQGVVETLAKARNHGQGTRIQCNP